MQVLGQKNKDRTINVGFTIPASVIEELEKGRPNYESRSHYVTRILSAHVDKSKQKGTVQ